MKKHTHLGIRIPTDLKNKLQKEAQKEQRSLSNLIILILIQYLENK